MAISLVPPHARWSFPAGTASLAQFTFAQINSSGQLVVPAATGTFAVVVDDAPSNIGATLGANGLYTGGYTVGNNYGTVGPVGCYQKVYYGATLSPGTAIMTNTSGQAVAAVTGAVVLGWTIEAGVSGDLRPVLLNAGGYHN